MEKVITLLFFVKNVCFSHKVEHTNLTDPSHDVTDDFSTQGKFYSNQTWVWLRVESRVDLESNAFRLSHELIWIEKWEALWVMSQSESIPGESTWVMSWF